MLILLYHEIYDIISSILERCENGVSIKKKITLCFGGLIGIMILCYLLILAQLKGIDNEYRETLENGLPQITTTESIEKEIILIGSQIQTYLLGNKDSLAELENSRSLVGTYIEDLKNMLQSKNDKETIASLETKVAAFYQKVDRAIEMVASGATRGSGTYYVTNVIRATKGASSGQLAIS